jgi:DNA-directed RNA polymerase subunit RPC12/RpoP
MDQATPSEGEPPRGRVRVGGETSLGQFACQRCGATLEFAPGTRVLRCPYCSHENQIPQAETPDGAPPAVEEIDYRATIESLKSAAPKVNVQDIECGACKAVFLPAPNITATACPFCGSNLVLTQHASTLIKPGSVLPFAVPRDDAVERYRRWIKSRWFAPTALRSRAMLEVGLKGMYVPAWTYDARTVSRYVGERGDAYYVTVGSGKNRRSVRRVRWSPASGVVRNGFDDILVMGTRSLPEKRLAALEPWDLKQLVPYNDSYLAGFGAETYAIDVDQGFEIAKSIMDAHIHASIRADIGGDEQRVHSVSTAYDAVTFKHLLLPVWISAYRYHQRTYRFLVNARTGEVQGERPYSWIKITLAVLAGLAAALMVLLLVAQSR